MDDLQIFDFENSKVRTLAIGGSPWFVGKDVAEILGYQKPRNAIATHVDEEDKKGAPIQGPLGGTQETIIINESGLYSLILGSKLPTAKKFKRWVTSEVLPSIRKHGLYAMDEIMENPDIAIEALTRLKKEREARKALELENNVQRQQLAEMQPKATYCDIVLNCKNAVNISVIAKDYGWSAKHLNEYLHEKGIQYKHSDTWLLYQKHSDCGYTKTRTYVQKDNSGNEFARIHTKWTQKGRLFIYELLKGDGIFPLIEKESHGRSSANVI